MIDFQRKILGDDLRNRAFAEALRKVIRPGETTVTDIGSGTGFLAFLAAKLGAKTCYLYESSEALAMSRRIARANGIGNCHFIGKHSSEVQNPVRTDLVLSETLGNFAVEEHIIENLEDGKRFLKPGGILLPQRLTQFAAPIVTDRPLREIDVWSRIGFGLDFAPTRAVALQNLYVQTVRPEDLLPGDTAVREWDAMDFRKKTKSLRSGSVEWTPENAATIYGFASFWECELLPGITLSTSPFAPTTHWDQVVLPLPEPLRIGAWERLVLSLRSDSRYEVGLRVRWEAEVRRGTECLARASMDTREGEGV